MKNHNLWVVFITIFSSVAFHAAALTDFLTSHDPSCPGTCTTFLICKAMSGQFHGVCMDGKICCSGHGAGYTPMSGSCGSSFMGSKVVNFHSPNYPAYSGGSLICDFTLQLSPDTVGIRIDFLDLNLPTVPSNPVDYYENLNPVCDSDFMILRGFAGWSPDPRCGNLTGYSFMIDREKDQPSISSVFLMTSKHYRWNLLFTEIYHTEIDAMDYTLKNSAMNKPKKQWIWYNPPNIIPMGPPAYQTSLFHVPTLIGQYLMRRFDNATEEIEFINATQVTNNSIRNSVNNYDDDEGVLSRIVGGVDAKPNSVPWQVSLQLVTKVDLGLCADPTRVSAHFCGGSIIGERTILTASHCFLSSSKFAHPLLPVQDIKVVVGEHDFCKDNEVNSRREYRVARIILHHNYVTNDVLNDIALIQLVKPIIFDQNVHQIHLADKHTKIETLKPLLSGWGSLGVGENSTFPSVLQQTTNLHILNDKECQHYQREFLDYVVPDYKLPGKYNGAFQNGICTKPVDNLTEAGFGDSGGPLAGISPEGNSVLLGIVSHMRPHIDPETDTQFHLNYFTKVAAYRNWILMSMIL